MSNTISESDWRMKACCVLFVTFTDNNERKFYSGDARYPKYKGNLNHWYNHLRNLAENKWPGKVKEFAIYRSVRMEIVGDPILKVKN